MYKQKNRSEEKWVLETMAAQGLCIRLLVLIVETNVKYHSSPHREDRSIVENVIKNEDLQEEIEDIRETLGF